MTWQVDIGRQAANQLRRLPQHIIRNLMLWVAAVETEGFEAVRQTPGFCDDALKHFGSGQGIIRLSRKYGARYAVSTPNTGKRISIEQVNPLELTVHRSAVPFFARGNT